MNFRSKFFLFVFIVEFGISVGLAAWNNQNGVKDLRSKTSVGNAYIQASVALHVITAIVVGCELVLRTLASAMFVYPCSMQIRDFCCFNYRMPKFWFILIVVTAINVVVHIALTVLLFFKDVGYPKLNITHIAILDGLTILQFVLALIARNLSVKATDEEEEPEYDPESAEPLEPSSDVSSSSASPFASPVQRQMSLKRSSTNLSRNDLALSPLSSYSATSAMTRDNMVMSGQSAMTRDDMVMSGHTAMSGRSAMTAGTAPEDLSLSPKQKNKVR